MDAKVDIKDLIAHIIKKWWIPVITMLLFAIICNIYGYRKASESSAAAEENHKQYELAASELPAYYTEELYNIRTGLSDNDAAYVEAVAGLYRNFIKKYGVENDLMEKSLSDVEDCTDLNTYVEFVGSLKDIKSAMNGTQQQYFNALTAVTLDDSVVKEKGAEVAHLQIGQTGKIQPKWILTGAVIGLFFGVMIISVPFVLKKSR